MFDYNELDALAEELALQCAVDRIGTIRYRNEKNELHRVNGPAVIYNNGKKIWCQYGEKHRTNGPAVIWANGTKEWYRNGKRHRLDGPAISRSNSAEYWFIDGVLYTEEEFNAHPLVIAHRAKNAL